MAGVLHQYFDFSIKKQTLWMGVYLSEGSIEYLLMY
jgi:hypothetical protein